MVKTNEYSFILAPSNVAGIGVFATHDIKKGTYLTLFPDTKTRFISHSKALKESIRQNNFYIWYCVEGKDGYYCPSDFSKMDIGWHLNHSKQPNAYHKDYEYFALVDIKKGDEIVIDYETLSEEDGVPQTFKPIELT